MVYEFWRTPFNARPMTIRLTNGVFCALLLLAAAGLLGFGVPIAGGADSKPESKYQLRLIWGTDDPKPTGKELKDVENEVKEKLKFLRWKNYFEVTRKSVAVLEGATQRVRLSDKCDVELQNLGASTVEVRLYGEGKCVAKVKEKVTMEKQVVIAGDAKNDTAWFVVVNLQ